MFMVLSKFHIPFCFRPFRGGGRCRERWPEWWDKCRCRTSKRDHRVPVEPDSGAGRVELPEASLPDNWVRKPSGPAAYGGKELWQASVEQPGALWQLGHLKHGPAEQYWALQGTILLNYHPIFVWFYVNFYPLMSNMDWPKILSRAWLFWEPY